MRTFPKSRIDALTDDIFAFAMTLLVLDIRLPADLHIRDSAELIARLWALSPACVAYVVSFFVLAAHWRGNIDLRRVEEVSQGVLGWTFPYLLFITSVPFSSSVVGRYGDLPPAVWLYAANLIVVAALSLHLRLSEILPEYRQRAHRTRQDPVLHSERDRLNRGQPRCARLRDVRLFAQHRRRAARRAPVWAYGLGPVRGFPKAA